MDGQTFVALRLLGKLGQIDGIFMTYDHDE